MLFFIRGGRVYTRRTPNKTKTPIPGTVRGTAQYPRLSLYGTGIIAAPFLHPVDWPHHCQYYYYYY
jgi:hypothetical protein